VLERWETYDERGSVTGVLLKETSRRPAALSRAPQPCQPESPVLDAVCRIVGFILLAATVALFWFMATAG
jgi:hypothetical protein